YATDADAGLLEDLAPHRVLERFARLHEAGKARIHARREAGLTPEQAALTVDREHDDHRVGARKVRRATLRAVAAPAGIGHLREGSAQSAEAVRPVPVDKAAGLSGCPELVLGKGFAHEQAANVEGGKAGRLECLRPARTGHRESRCLAIEAEQYRLAEIA